MFVICDLITMQPDVLRNCFLVITIAALYVQAEENTRNDVLERAQEKRISKREASIFIDNFPVIPISRQSPSVIYRRVSKQRYRSPKPKYGPPLNVYLSSKPRKPFKKYRRTIKPKYGPPKYKKHPTRTSYGPPKTPKYKPVYGPPKKIQLSSYFSSDPDFGEPPKEYVSDFETYKPHFGEPPTDSYGTPLHHAVNEPHISNHYIQSNSFGEPSPGFDNVDTFGPEVGSWQDFQSDQNFDNSYAYSKKHPVFIKPQSFEEQEVEVDSTVFADLRPHKESLGEKDPLPFKKKRRPFYANENIKSWRPPKQSLKPQEVLVGGRYAEPPARFVNKASGPLYTDDDEFPASNDFIDPDVAISATSSPYVNYKNSNMAFSPQNLNDAFSIVDK